MRVVMRYSVIVPVLLVKESQLDEGQRVWEVVRSVVLRSLLAEKRPASMNNRNTPVMNVHPRRWSMDRSHEIVVSGHGDTGKGNPR
jgi:hypothetical protein